MHRSQLLTAILVLCLAVVSEFALPANATVSFVAPDEEPRYSDLLSGVRQGLSAASSTKQGLVITEHRVRRGDAATARAIGESLRATNTQVAFVVGTELVRTIRSVNTETQIVFITPGDPVRPGLAASLARPGNNMTGMTFEYPELSGKRLEMLRETVPTVRRVGVVYDHRDGSPKQGFAYAQAAARALGLELVEFHVETLAADPRLPMRAKKVDGIVLIPGGAITKVVKQTIALAESMGLPSVTWARNDASNRALISYGVNDVEVAREATRLIARVLNGDSAGNLPIERPSKLELSVNMRTARQLNIALPPTILVRTDRLIE